MSPSEAVQWRLALGSINLEEYKRLSASLPKPSYAPNPILNIQRVSNDGIISLSREDMELHLQIYTLFRDYVKHEDSLINWRLSWNFAIQGFLFAAYAVATQKIFEANLSLATQADQSIRTQTAQMINASVPSITRFVQLLAGTGISVTVLIFFGVNAATLAIAELDERWRHLHSAYAKVSTAEQRWWHYRRYIPSWKTHGPIQPGLPGLVGGGIHRSFKGLGIAAKFLPWVFVVAWLYALWGWFLWRRVSLL